ncbi:MAG: oxidoreductase [Desulfobacterales bacterium S3730MH5]|nr:MAG: oxidoreductase [Desulfobacterales bacterium S3730MH5]OEU81365.1 MAG: oxidoreductase [Desulfobulbaceae bacterium C00003063]
MINVGVIGCGYWGPNLIRNFNWLANCNMAICCDRDIKQLKRMKRLYPGIETTTEAEALFRSPGLDAIGIATPVFTHYDLAREALDNGKHVFVEKPMTHSVETCLSLIEIAEMMDRVLMVGHTFEYTAAVNKAKELIEAGGLGEPLYISSIRVNLGLFQRDINVIWDLAPHDISVITYLLGQVPESVNCQGKSHYKKGIEDVANLTLNYDNGVIAFVHSSWLDPNKIRKTTIVGSKKMLVYDDVEPQEKIKIYDKGIDAPPYYDTYGDFQFSYRYGDIYSPRLEDYEPLRKQCEHFVDCIEHGLQPRTDGHSGLRVVSILEAASCSLQRGGQAVPVLYPDDRREVLPTLGPWARVAYG